MFPPKISQLLPIQTNRLPHYIPWNTQVSWEVANHQYNNCLAIQLGGIVELQLFTVVWRYLQGQVICSITASYWNSGEDTPWDLSESRPGNSSQGPVTGTGGGGSIVLALEKSPGTYLFHAGHAKEVLNESTLVPLARESCSILRHLVLPYSKEGLMISVFLDQCLLNVSSKSSNALSPLKVHGTGCLLLENIFNLLVDILLLSFKTLNYYPTLSPVLSLSAAAFHLSTGCFHSIPSIFSLGWITPTY